MRHVVNLNKGVLGQGDSAELWEEIISHIPDEVLLKKDVKILSVACGHCTEAVVIAKRMIALGISKEEVNDAIYLIDKYTMFTNPAKALYGFKNVITEDFLTWETDMKFDVIAGNPPFHHPTNKSQKIWVDFTVKAKEVAADDGIICLVTPNAWIKKPDNRAFTAATDVFASGLSFIRMDCNEFFQVGEDVGYWVVNLDYIGPYQISDNGYVSSSRYRKEPILFEFKDQLVHSLKMKFLSGATLRQTKIIDFYYSTAQAIEQKKISTTKTKEYPIPVFISAVTQYYTKKEFVTKGYKLILNKSGYYFANPINKYMMVTSTEWHGVGENGVGVPVSSPVEGAKLREIYSKKLFRFFINNEKSSGFNSGLLALPIMNTSKVWTDKALYKHFGLTQEEIAYIEANVK